MPTKKYKPNTPGLRTRITVKHDDVTTNKPHKSLTKKLQKSSGRNNTGSITVRHKGGGVKRKYRLIDFKRFNHTEGVIESIEYDPCRSSYISLVKYRNGYKGYILSPKGIKVGDIVQSGEEVEVNVGNTMPLSQIPTGSLIHNIELTPGRGGQLVRSAGTFAVLMAKSTKYATIKLPSGEIRLVLLRCAATYGKLANESHNNTRDGKAGIKRKKGVRPTVRGAVMNPCDHKHGGGEGRAPIGLSEPRTAYGKKANVKTRSTKKSNKHLVRAKKK